jgi:hypothetical protein
MPDFGIFRGFNSKLFSDKLFAGQLPTQLGFVIDEDAQAFFNRVTTAGGSLSLTERMAVNQLVTDLKFYQLWTKMQVLYPMVGASAAACAQNLKSSSFTGSFNGGWTFSSNGAKPNGTNAWMQTNYTLSSSNNFANFNTHNSHYSRTNTLTGTQVDMGAGILTPSVIFYNLYQYNSANVGGSHGSLQIDNSTIDSLGFIIKSATSSTSLKLYKNNALLKTINTTQTTNSNIGVNLIIAAQFHTGSARELSSRECAFASIGDGLTDTEASNFYTAIQNFQTTLSRQV